MKQNLFFLSRIPLSDGCYDPIRRVVTLGDTCFADYHCNDLPNTACYEDLLVPQYNKPCQCLPGNKPFLPDPRTGLVEGCAPLTEQDMATVRGYRTPSTSTAGPHARLPSSIVCRRRRRCRF